MYNKWRYTCMSLIIGFTCNSYENAYFVIFFYTKLPGQQRLEKTHFILILKIVKKTNSTLKLVAKIQVYENEYSLYSWKKKQLST